MREQPENLHVVGEVMPDKISVAETLAGALPECFSRVEAMEYAGAFDHFAEQLASLERSLKGSFLDESAQKPIRQNLKLLWNTFLKDTKDPKKKLARMGSLKDETEKALQALHTTDEDAQARYSELSDERKKYYGALLRQRAERDTVVSFPNEASRQEQFGREMNRWIDDNIGAPIQAAYAPELKHIGYIGELFNDILPHLQEKMTGYVKSLIAGRRGYSDFLPVTAATIRANIVIFLEQAPDLAKTFAELDEKRFDANESVRGNSL